jgi:hypothetical protein
MRFQSLMFAFFTLLQVGQAGVFEIDMWPEEGRPIFQAVGRPLELRALPSSSAPVFATVRVQAGRRLTFDETQYRTTAAGAFTALKNSVVTGRSLGNIAVFSKAEYYFGRFASVAIPVNAGEDVEYLQYRAEGTCFVRIRSNVIDAQPCPNQQPDQFRTRLEPTTEWWIHVTVSARAVGWVLVSETTVKEIDREG